MARVLAALVLFAPTVAQAQPAREHGAALYTAQLFRDDAIWRETVREERRPAADEDVLEPPHLVTSPDAGAELLPLQRMSIDQDVLRQLIVDRARQVAMRAVADVIGEVGGPIASRRYVQDLIAATTRLLLDTRPHVSRPRPAPRSR